MDDDDLHGDLLSLWREVTAAVAAIGRPVFPAVPDITTASVSWPRSGGGSWRDFLSVAERAGASVVYVGATSLPPSPSTDVAAVAVQIADQFPVYAGQIGEVELAFSIDGVVHYWSVESDWWADVREAAERADRPQRRREDFENYSDSEFADDRYLGSTWIDWRTHSGLTKIEDALGADTLAAAVERIAGLPSFQKARSSYERDNAVRDNPDGDAEIKSWWETPVDDPNYPARRAAVDLVVHRATERAAQMRADMVTSALANIDLLVTQLRDHPGWQEARLAGEKRRRIREFVELHIGFYSPDLADRIYSAVRDGGR